MSLDIFEGGKHLYTIKSGHGVKMANGTIPLRVDVLKGKERTPVWYNTIKVDIRVDGTGNRNILAVLKARKIPTGVPLVITLSAEGIDYNHYVICRAIDARGIHQAGYKDVTLVIAPVTALQGTSGAANSGVGGDALLVNGPIKINNLGRIYGGGGGGGHGGKGANVTKYTARCSIPMVNFREYGSQNLGYGYVATAQYIAGGIFSQSTGWVNRDGKRIATGTNRGAHFVIGGATFTVDGSFWAATMSSNKGIAVPITGGAGGAGGRGQGFQVERTNGAQGKPSNPGGGNAGGNGGNGGLFGQPGSPGIRGSAGGLAGRYIVGNKYVTWIKTGTVAGRKG